jgi:hypothetical protein
MNLAQLMLAGKLKSSQQQNSGPDMRFAQVFCALLCEESETHLAAPGTPARLIRQAA